MANAISVWREYRGSLELVGAIAPQGGDICFTYDASYKGQAISLSLPVGKGSFSAKETASFFSAIIPEGQAREEFARMFHAEREEFVPYLEHLRDESIGALLFSPDDDAPGGSPFYERVDAGFFDEFSARPLETAVAVMGQTRLSLSGAMAKVGLYQSVEGTWYYPVGGAPSTHIVKAADGARYPLETVNEALCLGVARRCGFPASECDLIGAASGEPLLAVRRFDRVFNDDVRLIGDLPAPARLHQEDFHQASAAPYKYEPTDGSYLSLLASTARRGCVNSFGEASLAVEYTLFDYLVGNCDNHLKNYALLYDETWHACEMAPLYDVVSTVSYPGLYLEMGVSFGGSRRIDDVSHSLVEDAALRCGVPADTVFSALSDLAGRIPGAIEEEADCLTSKGFGQVRGLVKPLVEGVERRYRACL